MKNSRVKIYRELKLSLHKLNAKISSLDKLSKYFSIIRLFVFITITISFVGFYIYNYKITAIVFGISLGLVFLILMYYHSKIEKSIKRFKIYIQIKKDELARFELDWDNIPMLDTRFVRNPTSTEQDLNITEKNGLLQLISNGITAQGINILREWLSGNAYEISEIVGRQKIIRELKDLRRFRTKLLLKTKLSINSNISKVELTEWIKNTPLKRGLKVYTIFLSVISSLNIFFLVSWLIGFYDYYYYQILLIYIFFYYAGYNFIRHLKDVSEFLYDEVKKYSAVFSFIEKYNYGSNKELKNFLNYFFKKESSPTKALRKINFTVEILNFGKNPVLWFVLICLAPIDYLLSIKVENFRESIKTDFPIWLEKWYHLEAYCSLATFASLNPEYCFADFSDNKNLIEAKNIGHPLITYDKKITNDYKINESNRTNIITGSNMSGKSTFLRTVGVNTLLAYAGSVVNAEKFGLSRFNMHSCIQVSDSVVDGISYFYAEVKRLKFILDEIKKTNKKALVLIDEIYKGTNNIERLAGSKAIIRYLVNEGIFSLISTHDLELVTIAKELKHIKNNHFKEIIEDSKMSFDYKLMDGPCPTTNALKIMQLEGLPT